MSTPASGPVNAYGKHGRWVRWRVVSLHYDHGWGAQDIFMHVNSGGDKDLSLRTVYNILEIFYGTGGLSETKGPRLWYQYLLMLDGYEHAVWPMQ